MGLRKLPSVFYRERRRDLVTCFVKDGTTGTDDPKPDEKHQTRRRNPTYL